MRLDQLREQAAEPGLWDDPDDARQTTKELARLEGEVGRVAALTARLADVAVLDELAVEEDDAAAASEVARILGELTSELDRLEVVTLLNEEYDRYDAIMAIHAGEGGVDAMDWAQILQRMYLRWAERRKFEVEVYDEQFGEEAGLKSTTFALRGEGAYGLSKVEHGVHRLVRISPFDANARRQTSFALVDVVPLLPDVETEIDVPDEEIRVDVYRSSGPGGQGVNTTDSAVRITHLPTGIVVACQNERSQLQNRAVAMRILKARLAERARREREDRIQNLRGERRDIEFGSQIRSYVLHPYRLVKDHRTGTETGNVDRVLDGELDELIEAGLRQRAGARGGGAGASG